MKVPEMTAWASQSTGAEKQNRKSSGSVMDASDAVKASGSSWAAVFLRFSRRGDLMLAAVLPGQLFELLLELQPGKLAPFRTQVPEIRGPHFGHHARIGIG